MGFSYWGLLAENSLLADDSWLTGHLRHMAQREREFTAWHAEHGAVALRVSFTRRVS